jgi:hypothetical protein
MELVACYSPRTSLYLHTYSGKGEIMRLSEFILSNKVQPSTSCLEYSALRAENTHRAAYLGRFC